MTEPAVTVEIVDVTPKAERVLVDTLRPGDLVFLAYGGRRLPLKKVRRLKRHIKTTRSDGWTDLWPKGSTITIIRKERRP
jgi:hypothetical protein